MQSFCLNTCIINIVKMEEWMRMNETVSETVSYERENLVALHNLCAPKKGN